MTAGFPQASEVSDTQAETILNYISLFQSHTYWCHGNNSRPCINVSKTIILLSWTSKTHLWMSGCSLLPLKLVNKLFKSIEVCTAWWALMTLRGPVLRLYSHYYPEVTQIELFFLNAKQTFFPGCQKVQIRLSHVFLDRIYIRNVYKRLQCEQRDRN